MNWRQLENKVRTLSSLIWERPATKEHINGVDFDCVLKRESDYWVIVEVTQTSTLPKLRDDLAKFASVRPYLQSKNIYCKCYFVCAADPPPSLKETGDGAGVAVMSENEFAGLFFDFSSYSYSRTTRPFGSSIDPISGQPDQSKYVPVSYRSMRDGKPISIADIADLLSRGRKVVLLGEYGTGKSRAVRELFSVLAQNAVSASRYPIAVDLRDTWGARRGHEIIRRHFDGLGHGALSASVVKAMPTDTVCFLLDGFDEIGAQSWSDDQQKLRTIRRQSLAGVADLIENSKGGVLVTGREHYFNSNEEMLQALGLSTSSANIIECQSEFTDAEMRDFLGSVSEDLILPDWLPKRPLICQVIANLEPDDLDAMFRSEGGDIEFCETLIDVICRRDAKINTTLDAATIKNVLRQIARYTRTKPQNVGPVAMTEINRAFETVVGSPPVDESAIMLQRLPALGRVAAETTDRQFRDVFILDGLRGLDVVHCSDNAGTGCETEKWTNPTMKLGQGIAARKIASLSSQKSMLALAKRCAAEKNRVLSADAVGALLRSELDGDLDFDRLKVEDAHFGYLTFAQRRVNNLAVEASIVDELTLPNTQPAGVLMKDCVVTKIVGVAGKEALPPWIEGCSVDTFEKVSTTAQIREAQLTSAQRLLVMIIKKIFFQKGGGRKEEALLRGFGRFADKGLADKIVNLLLTESLIDRHQGNEGWVYVRVPSAANRMRKIISELTLSADPLWLKISGMN